MSDTFESRNIGDVYAGEAKKNTARQLFAIGEAGIYPAYAVRVTTTHTLVLAKDSDKHFAGIAMCMPGHDLDTVYTYSATLNSTEKISIYGVQDDMDVWVFYVAQSPAADIVFGDILVLSATDGMFMLFAYANGTDITDVPSISGYVKVVDEHVAGCTTANQLVKVHLGG